MKTGYLRSPKFLTHLSLIIFLLVGLALRLYHFWDGYGFYGDQGRDLLEVHNWFKTGNIPLVGPITSVGNFHLGPFYYYLITPLTLILNFNPIAPVIFNLICGLLLIIAVFIFLNKYINFPAAFIGASFATLSPHLIFLSRGSWNPNPEPLFVIGLLYCLISLIKTSKIQYILYAFLILGVGVQLHYTFAVNLPAAILLLIIFKPKIFRNLKFYPLSLIGLFLPLLPFLIGQIQNNFIDLHYLNEYLNDPSSGAKTILMSTIIDRLIFAVDIFYPREGFIYYVSWLLKTLVFATMLGLVYISASKHKFNQVVKILISYFLICAFITGYIAIPFKWWYYHSFSIVVILLLSILIAYIYDHKKISFLWAGLFGIFIYWQIHLLPETYQVARSAQSVEKSSYIIINDIPDSPELSDIGIYVRSPVTLTEGYEYRFFIERNGFKTYSAPPDKADYIIIEDLEPIKFLGKITNSENYTELTDIYFNNFGNKIKYAKIYKKLTDPVSINK